MIKPRTWNQEDKGDRGDKGDKGGQRGTKGTKGTKADKGGQRGHRGQRRTKGTAGDNGDSGGQRGQGQRETQGDKENVENKGRQGTSVTMRDRMYSRLTKDVVLHCTDARFFVGRRFLKNAALLCLIISATGRSSILCINPFAFDSVQCRVADYLTCLCSTLAVTWIFHYCSLKMPQHFYSFQATTSAARPSSSVLICPILWKVSWNISCRRSILTWLGRLLHLVQRNASEVQIC